MGEVKRSDLWQKTKGGSLPSGGITHPLGHKITAIFSPGKPNSFPPATKFYGSKKSKCDKDSERVFVTTEKKTNTHCSCHVLKNTNSKFKVINCSEISLTNVQRRDNNSLSRNSLQTKTAEMSTFTITIVFNKKA